MDAPTQPGKDKRQSNIELLRIVAAAMVTVLHFNYNSNQNALELSFGVNHEFLMMLECISICAVDIFIVISGFFLCRRESLRLKSIVRLYIKAAVINMTLYLWSCGGCFGFRGLARAGIVGNYYITLYITLMVISPYINICLNNLDLKKTRILVGVCFGLFSIWVTFLDYITGTKSYDYWGYYTTGRNGSGSGYTLINFILCYIIGAWIRKDDKIIKRIPQIAIIGIWGIANFILVVSYHFPHNVALEYCNPLVILSAALLVMFFGRLEIDCRLINYLAPSSFTCFLIGITILHRINIQNIVTEGLLKLLLYLIGIFILIFSIAVIFDFIYGYIERKMMKMISKYVSKKG